MKINRGSLLFDMIIAGILYALAFAITIWFSHYHGNFYFINWASLGIVILACCFRRVSINNTMPTRSHIWQIMGLQVALIAIFVGISQFIGPVSLQSLTQSEIRLGFFPWATALLIAIVCRCLADKQQADITFLDMLMTYLPIRQGSQTWSTCFMYLRQTPMTILAFTLALLALDLLQQWQPLDNTLTLRHLLLSLIPLLIMFYKPLNKQLNHFVKYRKFLSFSIPGFALLFSIILTIASTLLLSLSHPTKIPTLLKLFNAGFNSNNIVQFFNLGWWFAWSAMTGVFIAHRSRHLSLIKMALVTSIVPILLILLTKLFFTANAVTYLPSSMIYISVAGSILLCGLLFQKDVLPLFIILYFPFKPNPKPRLFEIHLKRCLRTMCLMCFFAIPIGASAVAYFTCLIGLPLLIALPLIMLSLVFIAKRD